MFFKLTEGRRSINTSPFLIFCVSQIAELHLGAHTPVKRKRKEKEKGKKDAVSRWKRSRPYGVRHDEYVINSRLYTQLNPLLTRTGMTWAPQLPSEEKCFETLTTALALGANFWNGGELYGTPEYNSLHLLNKYFTKYPENADKVVLSIKGGLKPGELVPDGSEENIRRSVDECLRVLDGKKTIDIFECARQDPNTTVEQTVTILAQLVKEGKIKGIGLSEVNAETIRRAYVLLSSC